ncbi:restriction endonuclease subunit S [Actinokineospora spheciospongiae]|uniref:restriction endonuclease subunit S n=1 Tax=Actinokineospora spheciospongiae TaxID=909613 RepID=UPI00190F8C5B|nr:restriction endonuclease subunit S [Actinokineospora spheciospongiae]
MTNPFFNLPKNWRISRLDRIASVHARIGWKALTAAEYQHHGYAFLATPNIKEREIDFRNVNFITAYRYNESPELRLKVDDVLLVKDGNTLGITNIVRHLPRPATVNGSIAVLRPFGVNSAFLMYVLASSSTQGKISAVKDGMGVPHLFQADIKKFPIPLPPVEEQRRIADFLDLETSQIDHMISLRKLQSEIIKEKRQNSIEEIFSKLKPNNGVRLKRLLRSRPRYGVLVPEFVNNGVPFIRVNDLTDLESRIDHLPCIPEALSAQYKATKIREGDLLVSVVGTIGRTSLAPRSAIGANVARAVAVLRATPGISIELIRTWISSRNFVEQALKATASDSAQRTLGMEDLSNFVVPWPDDSKSQQEMTIRAKRIEDDCRLLDALAARQIDLLAERRQALITAAVNGQLDVTTARSGVR